MKTSLCIILLTLNMTSDVFAVIERFHGQQSENLNTASITMILGSDYAEGIQELRIAASPELAGSNAINREQAEAAANRLTVKLRYKSIPHPQALWMLLKINDTPTVRKISEIFDEYDSDRGLKYQPITEIGSHTPSAQLEDDYIRWGAVTHSNNPELLKPFTKKLLGAKDDSVIWRKLELGGNEYNAHLPHVTAARFTIDLLIAGDEIPLNVKEWAITIKQKAQEIATRNFPISPLEAPAILTITSNMREFAKLNAMAIENGRFADLVPLPEPDSDVTRIELNPTVTAGHSTTRPTIAKGPDANSDESSGGANWILASGVAVILAAVMALIRSKRKPE